jgi:hypothetical protein
MTSWQRAVQKLKLELMLNLSNFLDHYIVQSDFIKSGFMLEISADLALFRSTRINAR